MLQRVAKTSLRTTAVTDGSEYMNDRQLNNFRLLLEKQREELQVIIAERSNDDNAGNSPDPVDQASMAEDSKNAEFGHLRALLRVREINQALARIETGDFGYCEDSGEPIGIERLMANPTARYSIFAQSARELKERTRAGHH